MSQSPSADGTARLLLWNLQEPSRLRADPRRSAQLLDNSVVLKLALGRRVEFSDASLNRVGAAMLRKAAAAYVRQYHFRPDASAYQILGVAHDASQRTIRDAFLLLMQLVHPDRQDARSKWPEAFAAQANRAYATLRNADSRANYDREQKSLVERAARKTAAAARPPEARWHGAGRHPRKPPPRDALPEWLTAGVGGFVRAHPAIVAFGSLIAVAVLVIAGPNWDGETDSLAREARAPASRLAVESANSGAEAAVVSQAPAPVVVAEPDATAFPPATRPGGAIPARLVSDPRPGALAPSVVPAPSSPMAMASSAAPHSNPGAAIVSRPEPISNPGAAIVSRPESIAGVATDAPPPVVPAVNAAPRGPSTDEIEVLMVTFVDAFDKGRLEAITALFAENAQTEVQQGRTAIRRDFDELFRRSDRRRMQVTRISWKRIGELANARAEGAVRISWTDGREVEQGFAIDMELARRDGRVVIIRLSQRPGPL